MTATDVSSGYSVTYEIDIFKEDVLMNKKIKLSAIVALSTAIGCAVYAKVKEQLKRKEEEVIDICPESIEDVTTQK